MAHCDISVGELRRRIGGGEDVFVLDVREQYEVEAWSFPGALHIPLAELGDRADELPTDREIVVVCHAGVRSEAAAAALDRGGWRASNLIGGVVAWTDGGPGT